MEIRFLIRECFGKPFDIERLSNRKWKDYFSPDTMRASLGPTVWIFPMLSPGYLTHFYFEALEIPNFELSILLFLFVCAVITKTACRGRARQTHY